MKATAKNTAMGLVVSNESPIFALPSKCVYTDNYIVESTLWAYPCAVSAFRRRTYLAVKRGTPSFYIHTPTFDAQCQVRSRVVWRSIVTRLHLVMSIASSRIEKYCAPISQNPTSFGWKFTVIRRRLYIAMLRLSRPARRYWRLVQQSSSSSDAVLPSASTTSLSAAASSPNLKSFAL